MKNQESFKSFEIPKLANRQSFQIKIPQSWEQKNRSKTAQTNYLSQICSSRQTLGQSTFRNNFLWEKDWGKTQRRRQNQLNSLFRVRKQKLQQITKQNKNIYVRLNTQQSHYTHREMGSKAKQIEDKGQLSFKTLNMKESRQILGPIQNFIPSSGFRLSMKLFNNKDQDQNLDQERQSFTLKLKSKQSQQIKVSIRKKLGFFNPEQQEKIKTDSKNKRKSTRYLIKENKENQSFKKQKTLITSHQQNRLPEIYSFF